MSSEIGAASSPTMKKKASFRWPADLDPSAKRASDNSNGDGPGTPKSPGSPLIGSQGFSRSSSTLSRAISRTSSAGTLGRKDSFIAARRLMRGESGIDDRTGASKPAPTNEEVAQAVQEKVAAAVETQRKYKHVLWYSLFVAAYLIVLYLQASAYNSGEVVSTLRNALMPDGGMTATFQSNSDVLGYIGAKILKPTWVDPVCGDGVCEQPWEFPAWGPFGCKADCGLETQVTPILVQVISNFIGHPTISASVLMSAASWNLCLSDTQRQARGEADLCWFTPDQTFTEIEGNTLETMSVIDGNWYVNLMGDYAGRVSGNVYDMTNSTNPVLIATNPVWEMCALPKTDTRSVSVTAAGQVRKLLEDWSEGRRRRMLEQQAQAENETLAAPLGTAAAVQGGSQAQEHAERQHALLGVQPGDNAAEQALGDQAKFGGGASAVGPDGGVPDELLEDDLLAGGEVDDNTAATIKLLQDLVDMLRAGRDGAGVQAGQHGQENLHLSQ